MKLRSRKELERSDSTDHLVVTVVLKNGQVMLESQLRHEAVDRAPDGEPSPPTVEVDPRGPTVRGERVSRIDERLPRQMPAERRPLLFVACALEQFLDNHRREEHRDVVLERAGQTPGGVRIGPAKERNERRRIDQDHRAARSFLKS